MDELSRSGMRQLTAARVGLARAGAAIGTAEQLEFQLDHALARDAVHARLDARAMVAALQERGLTAITLKSRVPVVGAAGDRTMYLRRPDLGRVLDEDSAKLLTCEAGEKARAVFVLADGLSALAVERHALAVLDKALGLMARETWEVGPVCVVSQGRVAIGDEIGRRLGARMTVMMIGERPGLSAADSLGIYLTWEPRTGRTDAERNCISNVRLGGLSYAEAARRIVYMMGAGMKLGATGIVLKDSPADLHLQG